MRGVKVLTTFCIYKIISPYLKSLGLKENTQFKIPFRYIKSLGWRLQQVFSLWWVAVCLTLFTWYWVFVNVISYLQKIHTFYGSMYVCECAEGHMTISSYLVEQLDFFPLLLVMVVSAEVDWQMHARNPHSPFQRLHMMDCDLSAQQDTGTMQAVIGQVWSQPFLNSPFIFFFHKGLTIWFT